jgi:capsular polysaccharide biosynthesis protein
MTAPVTVEPAPTAAPRRDPSWLVPSGEAQGLVSYIEAIRAGRWIIIGALVACVGAALLYLAQADKVYEATSDLLVTPQQEIAVPLPGVIIASGDPTRDVETVAELVTSPTVARRAQDALGLETSINELLDRVDAEPVAESNIVAITASGPSPKESKALSDAFAREFVAYRTERLHEVVENQIARLEPQVPDAPTPEELADPDSLASQLRTLQGLRAGDDPSVSVEAAAELPTSASSSGSSAPSRCSCSTRDCGARSSCGRASGCRSSRASRSSAGARAARCSRASCPSARSTAIRPCGPR